MLNMGIDERLIFGPRAGDGVATVGTQMSIPSTFFLSKSLIFL
jgi:hypothetical protein